MRKKSINPDDLHYPRTKLIALENTCNKGGGSCYDFNEIKEISTFCRDNKLGVHLDGARLFNALIATKQNAFEYGKVFDSISIILFHKHFFSSYYLLSISYVRSNPPIKI